MNNFREPSCRSFIPFVNGDFICTPSQKKVHQLRVRSTWHAKWHATQDCKVQGRLPSASLASVFAPTVKRASTVAVDTSRSQAKRSGVRSRSNSGTSKSATASRSASMDPGLSASASVCKAVHIRSSPPLTSTRCWNSVGKMSRCPQSRQNGQRPTHLDNFDGPFPCRPPGGSSPLKRDNFRPLFEAATMTRG